jgi:hypothetical protein
LQIVSSMTFSEIDYIYSQKSIQDSWGV